jgi:siroheme synthase-like protein
MFPLFLDLTGRLVLVVGGGPVGLRKAKAVLSAGGRVRLVCLEPRPPELFCHDLDWLQEPFHPGHLAGVCLVIAAARPAVNAEVQQHAHAAGLWVNNASDPDQGDCHLPAVWRSGALTLAVSTGGAAPGLARHLRDVLAQQVDPLLIRWLDLLTQLRADVLARFADEPQRRELFRGLCDWKWLEQMREEGFEAVESRLRTWLASQPSRSWSVQDRES